MGRELTRPIQASGPLQEFAVDVARESWRLGKRAFRRIVRPARIGRAMALAASSAPTDELGVDERLAASARDALRALGSMWLGLEHDPDRPLPERGGVLVTFNRSGWPLPTEALLMWAVAADLAGRRRDVYVLWEPGVLEQPFVGDRLRRLGVVAATRANARTLLERGAMVVAFPEGAAITAKTYEHRYRLARFDNAFLFEEARSAGARIIPGAVIGNEESYPVLARFGSLPITPTFPAAGLLGLVPLPLRWRVRVGAPVEYPEAGSDQGLPGSVGAVSAEGLQDAVRARMQAMLGELLSCRRSIVYG